MRSPWVRQTALQALRATAGQSAHIPFPNGTGYTGKASQTGFTLLEVLVTLVLLGLLFLGLTLNTHFLLTASGQQGRLIERGADLNAVHQALQHLVEQVRPGSEWEPLVFVGHPHSAVFTSVVPLPTRKFRNQRADVALGVDAGHRLLLTWTPHLHAIRIRPPPSASAIPILEGVERLDVDYWPAKQDGGWTSVWHDSVPPRLIRIRIIFSDPDRPAWPMMVVAPKLDSP